MSLRAESVMAIWIGRIWRSGLKRWWYRVLGELRLCKRLRRGLEGIGSIAGDAIATLDSDSARNGLAVYSGKYLTIRVTVPM